MAQIGVSHSLLNWDSPTQKSVHPPPPLFGSEGGGAHSLAGERVWEGPNSDEGTDSVVL